MTLEQFNESVRQLKMKINGRLVNSNTHVSKFFDFSIDYRTSSFGIWNVMTKNTVAYVNPLKKVIYIRRNSNYSQALSKMKGWTVVMSDTMHRHNSHRNKHNEWYKQYYVVPQKHYINNLTEPTEVVVDLGHDVELRQRVLTALYQGMYRENDRQVLAEVAGRNDPYRRRRVTLMMGPPAEQVVASEFTTTTASAFGNVNIRPTFYANRSVTTEDIASITADVDNLPF